MMLAAMGLDEAAAAAAAPSRKRERADEPAEPSRRSGRNAGKEVFYGDAPHQTPISALITASVATLGERAAHGLPWPTLAQLVRPSLLEDPRLDQAFSLVRSATQTLLKAGKLRRSLLSLAEEQAKALELKPGDPRRTRTALRVLTIRTLQVSPSHLGEWDVALKDEPSEEETAAAREAAADRAHQRVIALEQKLREGAENTMDLAEGRYNTEEEIQHKLADARETAEAQAEAPPTPWTPAPDLLPELHSGGAAGGGGGSGTAAANDSDDDWEEEEKEPALDPDASPGCRVELMTSATTIRSRMRRNCETDATFFSLPPGWTRVPDESRTGRRRTQMVYSRLPDASDADEMDEDQEEEDIELNRATMTKVLRLMKELKAAECAWAFLDPVAVDDVPGYADVVATPMDLTTVQNKLDSGAHYFTLNALAADLRLIPANCIKFNAGVAGAEEYVQTALAFERQVERQLAIVRGADENAGVVRNRTDLEDILEAEWKKEEEESEEAAGPWLGHVVNGKWEIRSAWLPPDRPPFCPSPHLCIAESD